MLTTGRGRISLGPGKKMKVEAEKKTGKQDSERTTTGQDFVMAKATGVVNGSLNRCGLHKKGLLSYFV
jgi:hypothetical protein